MLKYRVGRLAGYGIGLMLMLAPATAMAQSAFSGVVRDITGLDRPQVLAILRSLVEEGRLVRHGEKRGTYYTAK